MVWACSEPPSEDPGCSASTSAANYGIDKIAELAVSRDHESVDHGDKFTLPVAGLAVGETDEVVFDVRNIAEAASARPLIIRGIQIEESIVDKNVSETSFECLLRDGEEERDCSDEEFWGSIVPPGVATQGLCGKALPAREQVQLVARYHRKKGDPRRTLTLSLLVEGDPQFWNAAEKSPKPFKVLIKAVPGDPRIKTDGEVVFASVAQGTSATEKLPVYNSGDAPLILNALEVAPDDPTAFAATVGGTTYLGQKEPQPVDPEVVIPPGGQVVVEVRFTAPDQFGHTSRLRIHSNDANTPIKEVLLRANLLNTCINYIPNKHMNFGFVPLGSAAERMLAIHNCGQTLGRVTGMQIVGDDDGVFALDTAATKAMNGGLPAPGNPIPLDRNERLGNKKGDGVIVRCAPQLAKAYSATLHLSDNSLAPPEEKMVKLTCTGSDSACPTAHIVAPEEIVPQAELQLIGDQSTALPGQQVVTWQWAVLSKPAGATNHSFHPGSSHSNPRFGVKHPVTGKVTVNVAGQYVFELRVFDDNGTESCAPAVHKLQVLPEDAIHVELTWKTPGDTDKVCASGGNMGKACTAHADCPASSCEHDTGLGVGADLDLHFAHQIALLNETCTEPFKMCGNKPCTCQPDLDKNGKTDPWFAKDWDCSWMNPKPNWGSLNDDDNPRLDLDDTDGWGPENLNLDVPEVGVEYYVGVHAWDDHDFGPSVATVRFWILGNLEAEITSKKLYQCDMWWVQRIAWPSGKLLPLGGAFGKVTKGYWTKSAAGNYKCKYKAKK